MEPIFSRIAVVGMGLMGGSLARALKAFSPSVRLQGISIDSRELQRAVEAGTLDQAGGPDEDLMDAVELVVYATPLKAALELMGRHRERLLAHGTAITDLVSLKVPMEERARALGLGGSFVGSHPMVGGTESGFGHSRADLYSGARVWLVPGEAEDEIARRVWALWESVGAHPVRIEAALHDEKMVWASHLPQLTSNGLALVLDAVGITPQDLGGGGRDMTRLAASSPEMWLDLLESAPDSLLEGLAELEGRLAGIRRLLGEGDLERIAEIMSRTRVWREKS